MSKRFITISNSSGTTIVVTRGVECINSTNIKSPMGDRLSIKPAWTNFQVVLKIGVGYYPIEIKNWNTVKNLEKDRQVTIGKEVDEADIPSDMLADVIETEKKLAYAAKKFDSDVKVNKDALERDAKSKAVEQKELEDSIKG